MPSSIRLEPAPTTRTGVFQFDHTSGTSPAPPGTFTARQSFQIPLNASRFRVHVRNRNFLGESNPTGDVTNFKIFVGQAADPGSAPVTAAFAQPPVQVQGPTTMAVGAEVVTQWVDAAQLSLLRTRRYMVSMSYTFGSSGQIGVGGGGHFVSVGDQAGQQAANAATFTPNQSFFDTFIEYTAVAPESPCIFIVSNSLSGPGNSVASMNRGDLDAWPHQWEMANRGICAGISAPGSWAANYGSSSLKWDHYATLASPLSVDAVVLMGLLSSDVTGGDGSQASVDVAKASYAAVVAKARSLFPGARIVGTTLPPRLDSNGATESARMQVNEWMCTSPCGIDTCIDIDTPLTDGANPVRLKAMFDSGDHTHWSPRAHALISSIIPVQSRERR